MEKTEASSVLHIIGKITKNGSKTTSIRAKTIKLFIRKNIYEKFHNTVHDFSDISWAIKKRQIQLDYGKI